MGIKGQPITVFYCSCPQTEERHKIAERTWNYWQKQKCELYYLSPEKLHCSTQEFNRLRRIVAEDYAKDDFYILTDDDCLPSQPLHESVIKATRVMVERPEFAVLSFWPIEASIQRWTPEEYEPFEDLDVMEHVSVGGLRFVRRGSQAYWPKLTEKGYDRIQADHLRKIGRRVGYFQHLRMNHLGEGKSDLWRVEMECV